MFLCYVQVCDVKFFFIKKPSFVEILSELLGMCVGQNEKKKTGVYHNS